MHRQQLDHLLDDLALADVSVLAGLLELAEQLLDLFVVVPEQDNRIC
jgi:hypothetical protein